MAFLDSGTRILRVILICIHGRDARAAFVHRMVKTCGIRIGRNTNVRFDFTQVRFLARWFDRPSCHGRDARATYGVLYSQSPSRELSTNR